MRDLGPGEIRALFSFDDFYALRIWHLNFRTVMRLYPTAHTDRLARIGIWVDAAAAKIRDVVGIDGDSKVRAPIVAEIEISAAVLVGRAQDRAFYDLEGADMASDIQWRTNRIVR